MKRFMTIASLLAAAAMLVSCAEKAGDENGGEGTGNAGTLRLVLDKDVIQNNGSDAATFKVMLGEEDVTSKSTIYDDENEELKLSNGKFTATKTGMYKFWASYGTYVTYDPKAYDSGYVTVNVIPVPVPAAATDVTPDKTSFVRRVFLAQSTGTECKYCPGMVYIMRQTFDKDKMVLAAVHNFASGDPAYVPQPTYGALGASAVPGVAIDLSTSFGDCTDQPALASAIKKRYDAEDAHVGISVNSVIENDMLIAKVCVKAAVDGNYNVGAWLLEDNISGYQADELKIKQLDKEHNYDLHHNCVRAVQSGVGSQSYVGFPLGDIKAGETVEKTFVMYLFNETASNDNGDKVDDSWKIEDLHLAVFVTEPDTKGLYFQKFNGQYYTVNNAIDCKIDCEVGFDYAE